MAQHPVSDSLGSILHALGDLSEDTTVPRNVRAKLLRALEALRSADEHHIKVSRAMEELDEIVDDPNMQPYTRTQIWNIVSLLETV
ncbi:UPF0147 family protein [Candidatus Woesearchaeota archaeon]|nr:UPF0147 family protein [Candidatus Woesearchaeota archaeon]